METLKSDESKFMNLKKKIISDNWIFLGKGQVKKSKWWTLIGQGLKNDVTRRFPYYIQDYTDGLKGPNTLQKVLATTLFLYFAVLLPAIATGVLNEHFTNGDIGLYQVLLSEIIGGLAWTLLSGQPLVIISNTLVVAFYNKVIFDLAQAMNLNFLSLYGVKVASFFRFEAVFV